jgi:hypothetical protein
MQLTSISQNNFVSAIEYRNHSEVMSVFLHSAEMSLDRQIENTRGHFSQMEQSRSVMKQYRLYDYLKENVEWKFRSGNETVQIEVLQFLQMYYYTEKVLTSRLAKKESDIP